MVLAKYLAVMVVGGMLAGPGAWAQGAAADGADAGTLTAPSGGQVVDTNPAHLRAAESTPDEAAGPAPKQVHSGRFAKPESVAHGRAVHARRGGHHRAHSRHGG